MTLPFAYQDRYVAFIDILGFKEKVKHIQANTEVFELLISLPQILSGILKNLDETYSGKIDAQGTVFSDSVVISTVADNGAFQGIYAIAAAVKEVGEKLLGIGALLRGGLSKGPLYHKDGILFGQGLIDAYHLETGVARVPRVVVTPEVEMDWETAFNDGKWFPVLKDAIKKDLDGVGFIDLFHFPQHDSIDRSTYAFFQSAGQALSNILSKGGMDLCAWSKTVWVAQEYNKASVVRRCADMSIPLPAIEIPSSPIVAPKTASDTGIC